MSIGDGLALLAVAFLVVGGLEVLRRALADRFNQKCAADDRGWNYRGFHGGPFDPATLPGATMSPHVPLEPIVQPVIPIVQPVIPIPKAEK